MEHIIDLVMQNGDTTLPKGKRGVLAYPSPLLIPCELEESEDEFTLHLDTDGLSSCENVKELSLREKLRLLYNCAGLEKLAKDFSVSLTPDNVYYDMNLLPKLMGRNSGATADEDFFEQYKALIGTTLFPKYTFEDYYNGGADLYKKNKRVNKICTGGSVEEMAQSLFDMYNETSADERENKTVIGKGSLLRYRIFLPLLALIAIGCAALAVYLNFFRLPFEEKLIRGNNAYLSSSYLSVQNELSTIETADLPDESKYILARSYVVSESLNSAQKENILTMLTPQTDAVYFDYWIELGRLNFDGAIDAAQRIGDDQLLLLAYMKYEAFLENDTYTLTGDEKAEKISDLKTKIEKLTKELEENRAEAAKDDVPETPVIDAAADGEPALDDAEVTPEPEPTEEVQ